MRFLLLVCWLMAIVLGCCGALIGWICLERQTASVLLGLAGTPVFFGLAYVLGHALSTLWISVQEPITPCERWDASEALTATNGAPEAMVSQKPASRVRRFPFGLLNCWCVEIREEEQVHA